MPSGQKSASSAFATSFTDTVSLNDLYRASAAGLSLSKPAVSCSRTNNSSMTLLFTQSVHFTRLVKKPIGLYRDVWIAAIASSRTRLATLSGVMCNTSQCELRSLRVNSGMLNVIRIVTYYTLIDCLFGNT